MIFIPLLPTAAATTGNGTP